MKAILYATTCVFGFAPSMIRGEDVVIPTKVTEGLEFSNETKRALRIESEADFQAWYSTDGKLDIGVGRTDKKRNLHHPIRFTLDELEGFFDGQKHKDLVVVTIAKHVWPDQELSRHVTRLRDYFVARGYQRIVIEQAHASGRGIHLEHSESKPAER